ncbi:MAG: HlyC/CorC family transporter [Ignavibacteria bacterium]|nr:HlyC/CorC family transporter [Ignavibacteria bacterium]
MDTDSFVQLLIVFGLFIVSAFFSASEVALFSIDEKKLNFISKAKPLAARYIHRLLEFPRKTLITILIGNNIANVGISILLAFLTVKLANQLNVNRDWLITIEIILLTVVLLLIGEIIPKIIANRFPVEYAVLVCYPIHWLYTLFAPITFLFNQVSKIFQRNFFIDKSKTAIKVEEIKTLADLSEEYGAIEKDEQSLIHGIIEFGETTVKEVMTNRTEMVAAEINESFDSLLNKFLTSKHSRLPIYKGNIDNIEGFVYIKDLLPIYIQRQKSDVQNLEEFNISKILRPAIFVPESKKIDEMFREFQTKNIHIAIVVDEFGGTAGLITMEDILAEVMSRFSYSEDTQDFYKQIDQDTYLVDAKIPIDFLEKLLDKQLKSDEDDYDTLGGFLLSKFEDLPEPDTSIDYEDYKFIIKEASEKRIEKVLIKKIKNEKV